jgi:hypothetical protein
MKAIHRAEAILGEDATKPTINVVTVWLHEGF